MKDTILFVTFIIQNQVEGYAHAKKIVTEERSDVKILNEERW